MPPNNVIEEFRPRPDHAVMALAGLASLRAGSCLEALIRSRVIPELASKRGVGEVHPRAAELAGLLLGDAAGPIEALLEQVTTRTQSLLSLRITLLEPAARLLGDMWLDDTCTEIGIILGLALLQSAVRRLSAGQAGQGAEISPGRVLVALLPGETHLLGAALASDTLHDSGWGVTVAFPADVDALTTQFRSGRFDALHLAVSDVFGRLEIVSVLRDAVRRARSASAGRTLRITVGGRMFAERTLLPRSVGADALLPDVA